MAQKTSNDNIQNKNDKLYFILLILGAIIFSVCTHLALINNHIMFYLFDKYATVALFIFPILCLAIIIISCVFIFKKRKFSFIAPVAISLVGCLLAFTLSDGSFSSKIESDFLKNEQIFRQVIEDCIENNLTEGTHQIKEKKLDFTLPEKKIIIEQVGNNKYAYFLVAMDTEDRLEGYVYDPYGSPDDWIENGEYSEPLDIEQKWSYFVYHKGVNYD